MPATIKHKNTWTILGCIFGIAIMSLELGIIFSVHGFEFGLSRLIIASLFVVTCAGAGHFVDKYLFGTIFHKEVNNPIKVARLELDGYYWLNGVTQIKYHGQTQNGRLLFSIPGLSNSDNEEDCVKIYSWDARKYISLIQEN